MAKDRILIVDDEEGIRFGIRKYLEHKGFEVLQANSCESAENAFRASAPDVAVVDYCLPDGNAVDLIQKLKDSEATVPPIIVLTAFGSIDLAVHAIKAGAEQFLTKPIELEALCVLLERLLENQRNRRKQLARASNRIRTVADPFIGRSDAIKHLAEQAKKVLFTERPVLIRGETGTGKGVLASWLHYNGGRHDEAFVDLNCAALSRELLETELFGHDKGAFTGAVASKMGLIEASHKGSLFLDEIGDMDPLIQPKLLKVLEEKQFRRLGEVRNRSVDIRLVVATHQDLRRLVQEKRFRSDLYYRVSTITLVMPPLRERVEDIPDLAQCLLEGFSADLGRGCVKLSPQAMRTLQEHHWPGNIRELRNILERGVLLADKGVLEPGDLHFDSEGASDQGPSGGALTLEEVERRHIQRVLREEDNNVGRAAVILGISRSSLYQKAKRYGILSGSYPKWPVEAADASDTDVTPIPRRA